jgi:hypothetical protein
MRSEFSSDIAGNGADCRVPSCTLEVKAGTSAEFRNPENDQTSDSTSENAFLHHDFPPQKLVALGCSLQDNWRFGPFHPRSRCQGGGQMVLVQFHCNDPTNCQDALGALVPLRGEAATRTALRYCRRPSVLFKRDFRHFGH